MVITTEDWKQNFQFYSLQKIKQPEGRKEVHRTQRPQILDILTNTVFQYLDCGLILLSEKLLLL